MNAHHYGFRDDAHAAAREAKVRPRNVSCWRCGWSLTRSASERGESHCVRCKLVLEEERKQQEEEDLQARRNAWIDAQMAKEGLL